MALCICDGLPNAHRKIHHCNHPNTWPTREKILHSSLNHLPSWATSSPPNPSTPSPSAPASPPRNPSSPPRPNSCSNTCPPTSASTSPWRAACPRWRFCKFAGTGCSGPRRPRAFRPPRPRRGCDRWRPSRGGRRRVGVCWRWWGWIRRWRRLCRKWRTTAWSPPWHLLPPSRFPSSPLSPRRRHRSPWRCVCPPCSSSDPRPCSHPTACPIPSCSASSST
mmetsp:Transcript_6795/g.14717  ORF Transcript_6795/g.14717 Transcript_6795/m.14717 type:complete len:221 (+) Transcript_6795:270-932(+)